MASPEELALRAVRAFWGIGGFQVKMNEKSGWRITWVTCGNPAMG
jgi:hypothetical protein